MEEKAEYIRVKCPACEKRLKVPPKLLGKSVACPSCSTRFPVIAETQEPAPRSLTASPVTPLGAQPQDDELKFLDDDTPSKTPKKGSLLDDFDLSEFDLTEVKSIDKPNDFAKNELDAISAALRAAESVDEEFRYSCKVCGTAMYARTSEIGNMARCPDCYAEFSIPRPLPRPTAKKPSSGPKLDDAADVSFKESAVDTAADKKRNKTQADDFLRRAEQDLEKDESVKKSESYDFDSYGAFQKAFGFLDDAAVWVVAAIPGLFLGIAFVVALLIQSRAGKENAQLGFVGSALVLVFFGLPLLASTLVNGLAILEASANKQRRVSQWPMYNMGDAIGEVFMLLLVLAFAAIPGGILGWLTASMGFSIIISTGLTLLSAWFLFPILLLGVLDNGAIMQPFSSEVIGSMKQRGDAWAAMYLWNALATLILFGLLSFVIGRGNLLTILGSVLIPFLIYFTFRQIGNLAAAIADVTDLNFDDEDPQDEEAKEPVKEALR